MDRRKAVHRAARQIGPRAVAAASLQRHVKAKTARHRRAVKHRNFSAGQIPSHVCAIADVGPQRGAFQFLRDLQKPPTDFLALFKKEHHLPGQLLAHVMERARRREDHRRMRVMPAGVHHARNLRYARLGPLEIHRAFRNRQRVHIRAQQHRASRPARIDHAQHAARNDAPGFNAGLVQRVFNVAQRVFFLRGKLRMRVQMTPVAHHLIVLCPNAADHVHFISLPTLHLRLVLPHSIAKTGAKCKYRFRFSRAANPPVR